MAYTIRELEKEEFPRLLMEIPDPPKKLFCAGNLPDKNLKMLCVVGSRKYTQYGRETCEKIISGLHGYPVAIISGLALGIDSLAHKFALENSIKTIAVPGSGLSPKSIYPSIHQKLADEIVQAGGALITEFEPDFKATTWSFPQRNRIMAGMADAVLVIEAEIKSGTLITSRLASEYNRDVLTVPGSIFSKNSEGPHMLIKLGATPVTSSEDVLKALGLNIEEKTTESENYENLSDKENMVVGLLINPMTRDDLIRESKMTASEVNMILTAMEIKGIIKESIGEIRLM